MENVKILVLSDTHIPDAAPFLPATVFRILEYVNMVVHLGDFVSEDVLDELERLKTTYAVSGNCDPPELRRRLPQETIIEAASQKISLWHGTGGPKDLPDRVLRKFPKVNICLFGHSHIPLIENRGNILLVNPGSATHNARSGRKTCAVLTLGDKTETEIVDL